MLNDETILRAVRQGEGRAVSLWEIAVAAGVAPSDLGELKSRLRELAQKGVLERKGKGYRHPEAHEPRVVAYERQSQAGRMTRGRRLPWQDLEVEKLAPVPETRHRPRRRGGTTVVGIVRMKKEGYGFLQRLDGEGNDLFLPPYEAMKVMDGDRIRVRIVPGRYGRDVAEVEEVVEHRRRQLLGTYWSRGKAAWIEPLDSLLPPRIPVTSRQRIPGGKVVKTSITQYGEEGGLLGIVEEVAGEPGDPAVEVLEIAYRKGFSDLFPGKVRQEAEGVPDRVLPEDWEGRRDLTSLPLVTIDGPDAQDFDDAVYVEEVAGGVFRLVVAIADVSHYVRPGTALDEEAFLRGTSLYFPTTVLPMLPENISNGICSLQPGVERLCIVADLLFDAGGLPVGGEFYPAVMRSRARCTYEQVADLLAGKRVADLRGLEKDLEAAALLASRLRARRTERGSLDFDLPESRILLEDGSIPVGVVIRERNDAHRMIEEFMLAANEAVASFFHAKGLPTIYRIHDEPDPDKLENFARLGRAVGFDLSTEEGISPKKIQALLRAIEGSPQQKALNMLLLRAMMQAIYSPSDIGHYGLAAPHYLHFTAPIRRYPDLAVHRLLKETWEKGANVPRDVALLEEELDAVASHSSEQERAAMDAEREADRFLKCLFMQDKVGERFEATVVGVADFGLFTEIDAFLIEGLIRGEEIGLDFVLDEERQRLVFPRSGRSFGVGDKVRVEVAGVDVPRRQISMALVADEEGRLLPPRVGHALEEAGRMMAAAWPGSRRPSPGAAAGAPGRGKTAPEARAMRPRARAEAAEGRGAAKRGAATRGAAAGKAAAAGKEAPPPRKQRPGKKEREDRKKGR